MRYVAFHRLLIQAIQCKSVGTGRLLRPGSYLVDGIQRVAKHPILMSLSTCGLSLPATSNFRTYRIRHDGQAGLPMYQATSRYGKKEYPESLMRSIQLARLTAPPRLVLKTMIDGMRECRVQEWSQVLHIMDLHVTRISPTSATAACDTEFRHRHCTETGTCMDHDYLKFEKQAKMSSRGMLTSQQHYVFSIWRDAFLPVSADAGKSPLALRIVGSQSVSLQRQAWPSHYSKNAEDTYSNNDQQHFNQRYFGLQENSATSYPEACPATGQRITLAELPGGNPPFPPPCSYLKLSIRHTKKFLHSILPIMRVLAQVGRFRRGLSLCKADSAFLRSQ